MFMLSRPNENTIAEFLETRTDDMFSYPEVGATQAVTPPPGYNIDHNRQRLGSGDEVFATAKNAICQWKIFAMSWVRLCYPDTPIEAGKTVVIVVAHFGFYSLNAARIVYT